MNEIYIIERSTGDSYEHWEHPIGWVESEKAAKEAIKQLEEAEPKCPVPPTELDDFESTLYDWSEIQSPLEDKLWAANPYQDGSEFRRPTDKVKYDEYMADVDRQLKEKRKAWFETNYPQWVDKLEAYDTWDDVRYENATYSYYSVPKFQK